MTGSKEGCNNGNCGACNVIMNGALVNACCVLGVEAQRRDDHHDRGRRQRRGAAPAAAELPRGRRAAVRHLHAGLHRRGEGAARQGAGRRRGAHPPLAGRQPLPLHRLRQDRPRRARRRRSDAARRRRRRKRRSTRDGHRERSREYKVIGTRPVRPDGVDKVTGRAQYGADIQPAGHAARAHEAQPARPRDHQDDRHVEGAGARRREGRRHGAGLVGAGRRRLEAAGRGAEHPRRRQGASTAATPSPPSPRSTTTSRRKRANLIEVEYEVLPHVLDVREAMLPGRADPARGAAARAAPAPSDGPDEHRRAHRRQRSATSTRASRSATSSSRTSSRRRWCTRATSSRRPRRRPGTPTASSRSGRRRRARSRRARRCAQLLNHPISKIKVIPTEIGGGFGGKISVYLEPVAALLSRKTGKPVTIRMDRTDVFEGTGPTPGTSIKVKLGATKDGTIPRRSTPTWRTRTAPSPAPPRCTRRWSPPRRYDIEHVKLDGYDVVVNKPRTQDYRAPSAPAAAFAVEQLVDEIAREARTSTRSKLRLMNASKEGTRGPMGMPFKAIGHEECLEAALNSPHYNVAARGPEPRPRRRLRLLVQRRPALQRQRQRAAGRHREPDRGQHRHRRHARLARDAARRDARRRVRGREARRRRHRLRRRTTTSPPAAASTFASGMAVHEAGKNLIKEMTARLAPTWQVHARGHRVRGRRLQDARTARRAAPSRRSPRRSSAAASRSRSAAP